MKPKQVRSDDAQTVIINEAEAVDVNTTTASTNVNEVNVHDVYECNASNANVNEVQESSKCNASKVNANDNVNVDVQVDVDDPDSLEELGGVVADFQRLGVSGVDLHLDESSDIADVSDADHGSGDSAAGPEPSIHTETWLQYVNEANSIDTKAIPIEPEPCPLDTEWLARVRPPSSNGLNYAHMADALEAHGYRHRRFISMLRLAVLEGGFRTDNVVSRTTVTSDNGKSAYDAAGVVHHKLRELVSRGALLGPFKKSELPFQHYRTSPLFIIPRNSSSKQRKSVPKDWRLIVHMSYPRGNSINSGRELSVPIRFHTTQVAATRLAQMAMDNPGSDIVMFKLDITAFYNQLPIRPHDWWQMGIQWMDIQKDCKEHDVWRRRNDRDDPEPECVYITPVCPFGGIFAVDIAYQVSRAVHFLNVASLPTLPQRVTRNCAYCDDFLVIAILKWALKARSRYLRILDECNLPVTSDEESDKFSEMEPAATAIYLGVKLDAINMTRSATKERMAEACGIILKLLGPPVTSFLHRHEFQSVVGKLGFVAQCVSAGAVFMRRMWNALRYSRNKKWVKLDQGVRADLHWWKKFAVKFNGISVLPRNPPVSNPPMVISTDATMTHFCMVNTCTHELVRGEFSQFIVDFFDRIDDKTTSISTLEILVEVGALMVWPRNKLGGDADYIYIHGDNMAATNSINSRHARNAAFQTAIREVWSFETLNAVRVIAMHVRSEDNVLADVGTRSHVEGWSRFDAYVRQHNLTQFNFLQIPRQVTRFWERAIRNQVRHNDRLAAATAQ